MTELIDRPRDHPLGCAWRAVEDAANFLEGFPLIVAQDNGIAVFLTELTESLMNGVEFIFREAVAQYVNFFEIKSLSFGSVIFATDHFFGL